MNSLRKFDLVRNAKRIHIPIHGSVNISIIAKIFIDNPYFQRLRKLKQLGTCEYVFPSATHTRFEHSIGTYYLCDRILNRIKLETKFSKLCSWLQEIDELKNYFESDLIKMNKTITWIFEMIKIGALCHDIGHGPFSHLFDDVFIRKSDLINHDMATHEARSTNIIKLIVNNDKLLSELLNDNDVKFIQSIIDPDKSRRGFAYQIVSNYLNGLDVDKYDYILRDCLHVDIKTSFDCSKLIDEVMIIDNKIVYPEQALYDIYNLFLTRHDMHRRVYSHKGVISAEYLIVGIMKIIDNVIGLSNSIDDMNKFLRMTDGYILEYGNFILENKELFNDIISTDDLKKLEILLDKLSNHSLYSCIGKYNSIDKIDLSYFDDDNHMILQNKIGFVSGNKLNPLDRLYVYKTKDLLINGSDVKSRRITKSEISKIIPEIYQEYINMVFRKDYDDIDKDKEKFKELTQF